MTFTCLSGLPRSGSTLLSAILSQNPEIHAEGNSAVCQLMWDIQQSCELKACEQLKANRREADQDFLISQIPHIYYRNVTKKHIVDKSRAWVLPDNVAMLHRYIRKDPKIIVLVRPIEEIVDSFVKLYKANNLELDRSSCVIPNTEPIMIPFYGVLQAKEKNKGEFLFIEYDDLVEEPGKTLKEIYDFCEWKFFQHDFENVVNLHPEDDSVYGLIGMHDVRPKVSRQ